MVAEIVNFFMAPLLRVNIEQVVASAIDAHDEDIVELNRTQLQAGQLSTGADIKPFYRPVTIKIKQRKGQATDKVTLRDKGGFYAGTFAKRISGGTEVSSTDEKTGRLVDKYTIDIFGLSVASREQLAERIKPTLQNTFNRALH